MLEFRQNQIMPRDYLDLRRRSGNGPCKEINAVGAIRDSLYTTGVYQDGELIAFARVCGDGFLHALVCDFMMDERYADDKLAALVVKDVEDYLRETIKSDTTVVVMVDSPYDKLFARFGYKYLDEDFELAMKRR